jgi:cytochrome P450
MKTITGPKTPRFLQIINWILDPVNYLEKTLKDYPDVFKAQVIPSNNDIIFVSDPKILQQILTNDRKQFPALGETNKILSILFGDYSVILLDREEHKQRRQLLMPPFHGQQVSNYGTIITDITERMMAQTPLNQVIKARTITQSITLQVIMEVVFGISTGERYQKLKTLLTTMLEFFEVPAKVTFLLFPQLQLNLGKWSPWGNFLSLRDQIDELIYAEITERREEGKSQGNDILSLLMSAQDTEGNYLTDQELRDELMTLLFAGHETTATALAWGIYWTHRYPEIKEKILAELASLENPDPMAIARLPYLTAVCNETLRIYPVALLTFTRTVQTDTEIEGYHFKANSGVMGCIYQTHHRSDIYPDPETFKPERFLEKQFSPYEFMPFGGGVRRCIGEVLALFELKLGLAEILANYEIALADTQPEKPQRRGLTLAPAGGVKIRILGKVKQEAKGPKQVS